jgi:hypothetical protein
MRYQKRSSPTSFRSVPTFRRVYIVQLIPSAIRLSVSDFGVEDSPIIVS